MKKKMTLVPGVRYKGYAYLNEFGQIQFDPEEKGAHEGRVREVKTGENYSVKTTAKYILINMKIERTGSVTDKVQNFLRTVNKLISIFREYDF